ncbi:Protein kinase C beta type, partial [Operophtera brumata]
MAFSFNKLKNILNSNRDSQLAGSGSLDPEIGFKLALHPVSKKLYVTVIGARHLPSLFGLSRAHGYLVKVESSWPVWNEDFTFIIKQKDLKKASDKVDLQSLVAGHFLSLTIYAVLEPPKDLEKRKSAKTLDSKKSPKVTDLEEHKAKTGFLEKTFSSFKTTKGEAIAQKSLLEKRRTIGAATWNFDSKLFQNDLKNGLIGTPDIWRPINAIASAPLYLKATILEANKAECYWKSDRFVPAISARWDPKSSTVKLSVFKASLDKVSIYISLGCKTKMAKKEILGKATIEEKSPYGDTWKECLRQPGVPKTFW